MPDPKMDLAAAQLKLLAHQMFEAVEATGLWLDAVMIELGNGEVMMYKRETWLKERGGSDA